MKHLVHERLIPLLALASAGAVSIGEVLDPLDDARTLSASKKEAH